MTKRATLISDSEIHFQTLQDALTLSLSLAGFLKSAQVPYDQDRTLLRLYLRLLFLVSEHPRCPPGLYSRLLQSRRDCGLSLARSQTHEPDLNQLRG